MTPTSFAPCDAKHGTAVEAPTPVPARDPELGSASVLVALWVIVLTVLGAAATVGSSVLALRTTVAAAADMGALAGASGVLEAASTPCQRGAAAIEANGASMTACRLLGSEVWVEARVPAPAAVAWLLPGRGGSLGARAHAELVPDASVG
ncbi:MAG TPA: Rv3654c family TadE-like protein [Candidatus Nanopelagicales bacterium]